MFDHHIVVFDSVFASPKETHEMNKAAAEQNNQRPLFKDKDQDKVIKKALDLSTVVDWEQAYVLYNSEDTICVYARLDDGTWSRNLLIDFESFTNIMEEYWGQSNCRIDREDTNFDTL